MSVKMAEDVEGFESAVRKACQVFGVEKLFSQQFETLKTFVSGTERKSSQFHLVHSYVAEMGFF